MAKGRRKKGEGGITKRKDGLWMGTLSIGRDNEGKQIRKYFYGKSSEEVAKKMNDARYEVDHNLYKEPTKRTVGIWLDEWLKVWKTDLLQTTRESYQYQINAHIKPELGHIPLVNLDGTMLQKFISNKKKTDLSPRSIRYIHTILKAGLAEALRQDYIRKNPAVGLKLPEAKYNEDDDKGVNFEYFTLDETKKLLDIVKHDKYYTAYYFAINTGVRRGELLALRWSDIDFSKGTVKIKRNVVRTSLDGLVFHPPKTKNSIRTIELDSDVCEVLKFHKARQEKHDKKNAGVAWKEEILFTGDKPQKNDLVFPNRIGEPLDPRSFSIHFKRLLKGTELEGRTIHALRHTYATLCLQEGIDVKTVSANLGHHTASFTLDVYVKRTETMGKRAAEILGKALRG